MVVVAGVGRQAFNFAASCFAVTFALLVVGTSIGCSDDKAEAPTGPLSATEILTNLGVTEVSSPPPATATSTLGTTTTIDPSTWHPLKKQSTVFSPRAEVLHVEYAVPRRGLDAGVWRCQCSERRSELGRERRQGERQR